ncbi:fasciclin domain-containing protein [Ramlibacter ginsenosidimutans]|uniref:Fasciclin domain-containing protein n=2 Tax=Ramlibacter ginsenosidimutans TaxID=502333 RepID=A0A934WLY8_9BURK|nr:fasciclin domain-containing protein [Ramlibacter ginsenosidimutans]
MQRHLFAICAASLLAAAAGPALADGYGQGVPVDRNASVAGTNAAVAAAMGDAPAAARSMGAMGTKMVGGAAMYPTRDIIDNAVNSRDHTTLVAAVKAAGLVDTLKTPGPFTVFAPTNAAFAMLPAGAVDNLLKPENKATLAQVLTYHVVPGRLDAAALAGMIRAGGGHATLKTVEGEPLTVSMRGNDIVVSDVKGDVATVTTSDVYQSNGVIHVVDHVLLPG